MRKVKTVETKWIREYPDILYNLKKEVKYLKDRNEDLELQIKIHREYIESIKPLLDKLEDE